jgi:Tfp pilus assembly protein PilX
MKLVKTIKSSTIKLMFKEERGLASIVIVSVLIILISLISLGFARIMNRTVSNSSNHALSVAATYGAQSALNDIATYIRSNPTADSTSCNSLIGTSTSQGPFFNDSDLSASGNRDVQLTCLLLDQTPNDLVFQNNTQQKSRIIRLNTSAAQAKILVSWQATNPANTNMPPSNQTPLYDQTTWNSQANGYIPVLRLTLYPATNSGTVGNMEANSRTIYLYPDNNGGHTPLDFGNIEDGHIYKVECDHQINTSDFNGSADYQCNIVINNLLSSSPTPDYYYLRLVPIYNNLDLKIKANDVAGNVLSFNNTQALADVTTQTGGVSKRLQARLNITSTSSSSFDVAPDSNAVPEQSVRSANTLCKRLDTSPGFLNIDDTSGKCSSGANIVFTPPTVTLTAFPTTIYAGQSSTLTWVTANATSCTASNSWNGAKSAAGGSQSTGALGAGTYTYTIICSGPGGPSPPSSATVTVIQPMICTADQTSVPLGTTITFTALYGNGNYPGYIWTTYGGFKPGSQFGGQTFATRVNQPGPQPAITVTDGAQTATCPVITGLDQSGGGGCTSGCGGAPGCDVPSPSPPYTLLPDPCVRDVVVSNQTGPTTAEVKVWASHCYGGLFINGVQQPWYPSPDDNSTYFIYTIGGLDPGGGTISVTCSNGSSTAYGSANYSAYPSSPPQPPQPPAPGPPNTPPSQTIYGCDWGDGNYDADISSNFCWVNGGNWGAFCRHPDSSISRGGC